VRWYFVGIFSGGFLNKIFGEKFIVFMVLLVIGSLVLVGLREGYKQIFKKKAA